MHTRTHARTPPPPPQHRHIHHPGTRWRFVKSTDSAVSMTAVTTNILLLLQLLVTNDFINRHDSHGDCKADSERKRRWLYGCFSGRQILSQTRSYCSGWKMSWQSLLVMLVVVALSPVCQARRQKERMYPRNITACDSSPSGIDGFSWDLYRGNNNKQQTNKQV